MGAGGRGGAPKGHETRTIIFGPDTYMYVGISSLENVDTDSRRSRVYRFDWSKDFNGVEIDFETGQIWADGLRNPLALAFSKDGKLYELDNGPDVIIF
jgi:glucose/arabinose dehydrogenase